LIHFYKRITKMASYWKHVYFRETLKRF